MPVDIDLSQVAGLAAIIESAPEQAFDVAAAAGIAVGAQVQKAAKAAAPRDRPWLATQGIRRRTWRQKDSSHTDIVTVPDDRGINVGFFVEYGTSSTPPVPFLSSQMTWAAAAFEEAVVAGLDPLKGAP